jgi:glucoamylase
MVDTVKLIDALTKINTPFGTTWHRYNDDGYGEHADGSAFDGTGIGHGWPLLTGERAHYELASNHTEAALQLKTDMEHFAGSGGLFPEQVWDSLAIPEHELEFGRPTGSAMPLAWAHGEYLKLLRSLNDGRIFDRPAQTVKRYLEDGVTSMIRSWRFNHKIRTFQSGKTLRIETLASATIHWTADDWQTAHDTATIDTGLGVHFVDLNTNQLPVGAAVAFTFYWHHTDTWEGTNFSVDCR